MGILLYPYFLVAFWYRDFFLGSLKKSYEVIKYVAILLSLPLLLLTFFKPLKNEYHEGLVLFSVIVGMIVKSILISVSLLILLITVLILIVVNIMILFLPFILIVGIFYER